MSSKLILLLFFVPLINYTRQAEVDKQCEHKNYRVVGAALTNLTEEKYYLFLESDENEFGDRFTTFKGKCPVFLRSLNYCFLQTFTRTDYRHIKVMLALYLWSGNGLIRAMTVSLNVTFQRLVLSQRRF